MMHKVLRSRRFLFSLIFFTVISIAATTGYSEAGPINCKVRGAVAGPVRNGKQLIIFETVFRNTSQQQYISRVNFVNVTVHGYFNGREETYQRKVDVDWDFSPILEPGQRKSLRIKFWRKVQPHRGSYPYDDVEVRVDRINFKRAS